MTPYLEIDGSRVTDRQQLVGRIERPASDPGGSDLAWPLLDSGSKMANSMAWIAVVATLAIGCGGSDDTSATATGGTGGTGGVGQAGAGGTTPQGGTGGTVAAFRTSLSVSPFTGVLFQAGASFSDGTLTAHDAKELQKLYVAHGSNEVYARISSENDPDGKPDDHSLATALSRATLARDLGLPLNPELGLWAHYGDITCQPAPDFSDYPAIGGVGPWQSMTLEQIIPAFRDYGALVAKAIIETGVTVNVWDIGNEVDFGFAGIAPPGINCSTTYVAPDAVDPEIGKQSVIGLLNLAEPDRITWLSAHVWPHEAKLLGAVADGVRSVVPNAKVSTHISQSLSPSFAVAFYKAMASGGFQPDVIGFSLYPSASDIPNRAERFRNTVSAVQTELARPVFIAEFGYPAGPTTGTYATWTNTIPGYPLTEDGQALLLRDLAAWAPSANVVGIRPWAPEVFIEGWEGFALFASSGAGPAVARKGLDSIAEGLAKPNSTAFHD